MRKLSESVWDDIRRQSAGKITRIEEDIDGLDIGGFEQYLRSIYEIDDLADIVYDKKNNYLYIPVCRIEGHYCSIRYHKDDNYIEVRLFTSFNKFNDIFEERYPCYPIDMDDLYRLRNEKNDVLTNTFVREMIDFMLDTITSIKSPIKPVLTRK